MATSTQVKFRRGTTSQHSIFTGADGEITVDTDRKSIVVHDAVTAGGIPIPNWAAANATFRANVSSGVTPASYGSAVNIPILTIDTYGRVTYAANVAVNGMDYPFTNNKVASVTSNSNSRIWANTIIDGSFSENVFIDLATTGVTASVYGNNTIIPIITIDAYGRITSAANVGSIAASTFTSTTQNSQFNSVGVNTAASGTAGEIRATNNITAYYSDIRLKDIVSTIPTPVEKVKQLSGIIYKNNDVAAKYGYTDQSLQVGVIAQEVQKVLPQIVKRAPFDTEFIDGIETSISGENYMTVQYEKIIPLLIEAIKEQEKRIVELENKLKV